MGAAIARAGSLRFEDAAVAAPQRMMPREDTDPRWVIAVAAARALEGGQEAILPPEDRERVTRLAKSLGLRAFDAALVIAIVQDAARRGEPLGGAAADRLRMVPRADTPAGRVEPVWGLVAGAVVCATVLLAALMAWIQA